MDNAQLGRELIELGGQLQRSAGIPTAEGQAHQRRQILAQLRELLRRDGPPDATGVYLPGTVDGEPLALDIADARLSDPELIRWLCSNGLNPFGVRLVGVMLGREALRSFAI